MPIVAKPGWKTTEFWGTLALLVLNNISALPIPDRYQGLMDLVLPAAYAIARGLAKHGTTDPVASNPLGNEAVGDPETPITSGIPVATTIEPDQGDAGLTVVPKT